MAKFTIQKKQIMEILGLTGKIIGQYGPRLAGTQACLHAAKFLERELKKHCDKVFVERYTQYPGSFFNITKIICATYVIASGLYFFQGRCVYLSFLIYSLGMIYFIVQFIFLGSLFDRFFKKAPGFNVYGVVEPGGKAKQQIILSGHHDSAYACHFLKNHQKLYAFRLIVPVLFLCFALVVSFISLFCFIKNTPTPIAFYRVSIFVICLGFPFVIPLYYYNSKKASPGAGDNLLSSVLCVKIAEAFNQNKGALKNTRLLLLSTDGEEIGQKGVRDFIKRHLKEFKKIKTYEFCMDSIYRYEDLTLLKTDQNGTVRLSGPLAKEAKTISERLGYSLKLKKIPFCGGGTDAAQFAKAGVESMSLIGISTQLIRDHLYYHTLNDIVDNIQPQAVEAALNLAVQFILYKDSESVNERKV
jgi:aminopeptidase YwaD